MISIVIPSYGGSDVLRGQLPVLVEYLKEHQPSYEVIVVDDGSSDYEASQLIAKENGCQFLRNEKNEGKGSAVRKGVLHATGEFVLYTDVDIPFRLDAIDTIVHYLDFKEFHMAIGDRSLEDSSYFSEIPLSRKWGSAIFTFLVGRFVTTGHYDTQCGLKGFRSEIAKDLFGVSRINGFSFDVEIIYIALKRNYDIKRIAVELRNQEGSTVSVWKHGPKMLIEVLHIKWHHLRGRHAKKTLAE